MSRYQVKVNTPCDKKGRVANLKLALDKSHDINKFRNPRRISWGVERAFQYILVNELLYMKSLREVVSCEIPLSRRLIYMRKANFSSICIFMKLTLNGN